MTFKTTILKKRKFQKSYGSGSLQISPVGQLKTSFNGTTQNFRIVLDNASNNYVVTWGDGNSDTVLSGNLIAHTFTTSDEKLLNFQPETGGDKVLEFNYIGIGTIAGDLDFSAYDSITRIEFRTENIVSILLPIVNVITTLKIDRNSISVLNTTNLSSVIELRCERNCISILDATNLSSVIFFRYDRNNLSAAQTDQIFIDLDGHGLLNGILDFSMNNGRTAASDTANANLLGKGWTITGP